MRQALLLDAAAAGLLNLDPYRWITLKNGKRLQIDDDGRIVAGMPERYHGTSVHDLSRLSHEERELEGVDCEDVGAAECPRCRLTFRTKDEAAAALLAANPVFASFRESEFVAYDMEFLKWQRGGRVGRKPRTKITDGRLDAINEYYDLKGANRVASFTEALYFAIPVSRRWADLEARLGPLSDAAGVDINLPDEVLQLNAAKLTIEECEREVDRQSFVEMLGHVRASGGQMCSNLANNWPKGQHPYRTTEPPALGGLAGGHGQLKWRLERHVKSTR